MKTAVFFHIPKTAGSALIEVMGQNYAREAMRDLYTLEAQAQVPKLLTHPEVKLLYGHLFFQEKLFNSQEQYLFTFLRQPVERVISNFLYLKHSEQSQHRPYHKMSLPDFLKEKQARDNQTRFLAGERDPQRFLANRDRYFEVALRHLQEMALVGVQERFRDGLKLLAEDLQWRRLRFPVKGAGGHASEAQALKQQYGKIIAERNSYDQALYDVAQDLFEQRWRRFSFWQKRRADWRLLR